MDHLDLAPWLLVIPARFNSSRLPYKMKQDLCGKPLIIRVYENLRDFFGDKLKILVATDAQELSEICRFHKVPVFLTSSSHKSGTDRCYEVARAHDRPYILNVQGDEPFLNPKDLVGILQASNKLEEGQILTLAYRSHSEEDFHKLSVVKLIPKGEEALTFARSDPEGNPRDFYHHLGVYAYHKDTLKKFCSLAESPLEQQLRLEQMRALENGLTVSFVEAKTGSFGIDTEEDLIRARNLFPLRKKEESL